ncbi:siderophore-interacting protein [Micromonospora sp. NPDC005806]|uniref:siderophore-interacting protein n=1 Tax=Micromonospora sp. NPDC005806 TaxID=3364234 RepID=UPI0036C3B26E
MVNRQDDLVRRFAEACQLGDLAALRAAPDTDAIAVCDGGGLVPAAMGPIHGAEAVAQLAAVLLCGQPGTELTVEAVNGRAGLALHRAAQAIAVVGIKTADARIAVLWIVLNPAKLRGWHR